MSKAEVLLIGAGPVGSLLASALMIREIPFDWYIRNPQVRELASRLEIQLPERIIHHSQQLVAYPDKISKRLYNTVITSAKSQQTEQLMASLPHVTNGSRLAVANGLIHGDFHLGLLYGGAYLEEQRLVTRHSNTLRIGGLGSIVDDSHNLCALLACEWLNTEPQPDIEVLQWHKLCLNCILNPLTAVLDVPNGSMLEQLHGPLVNGLVQELQRIARRHLGSRWQYTEQDILTGVRELILATRDNSSSMREDLRQSREPEISHMNGAIERLGREYEAPCPLNEALSQIVIEISAGQAKLG
jgi:2-dehydropantoate 2-reductase